MDNLKSQISLNLETPTVDRHELMVFPCTANCTCIELERRRQRRQRFLIGLALNITVAVVVLCFCSTNDCSNAATPEILKQSFGTFSKAKEILKIQESSSARHATQRMKDRT